MEKYSMDYPTVLSREDTPLPFEKQKDLDFYRNLVLDRQLDDETIKPAESKYALREGPRQHRIEFFRPANEDDSGTYVPHVPRKRRAARAVAQNKIIKESKSLTAVGSDYSATPDAVQAQISKSKTISLQMKKNGRLFGSRRIAPMIAREVLKMIDDPDTYIPTFRLQANQQHARTETNSLSASLSSSWSYLKGSKPNTCKKAPLQSHGGPLASDEKGTFLATRLAHPLRFETTHCHWCDSIYYGLTGLPDISEDQFIFDEGANSFVAIDPSGHELYGRSDSQMCSICVSERIRILRCSKHRMKLIKKSQTSTMTPESTEDYFESNLAACAPFDWCSICTVSLAALTCNACTLQLCENCTIDLRYKHDGNLGELIAKLPQTNPTDNLLLRADATLLHPNGKLNRMLERRERLGKFESPTK